MKDVWILNTHSSMAVKDRATLGIAMGKGHPPAWAVSRRECILP